ncbi:hypothetical protein Bca4012_017935 [Brassica carinata]|uniref:Uncharacterized protein n=1 Tax=Brassica carinata TaxID=52824 RepID=A0A8X7P238_BRACI|nr:hypothetical protein Bca52824_094578 [Brassica carinata]
MTMKSTRESQLSTRKSPVAIYVNNLSPAPPELEIPFRLIHCKSPPLHTHYINVEDVSNDSPPYHKKGKPIVGSTSQKNQSNSHKNIQHLRTEAVISSPAILLTLLMHGKIRTKIFLTICFQWRAMRNPVNVIHIKLRNALRLLQVKPINLWGKDAATYLTLLQRLQAHSDIIHLVENETLSPPSTHAVQLRNTLYFANRAKEVTNNAQVNMGHIWRTGFECNELKFIVFVDVAEALEKWH